MANTSTKTIKEPQHCDCESTQVNDSDMVGLLIHNENNEDNTPKHKEIGFSFIHKDQLSSDVIWRLFEKVAKSNARFNASDPQAVTVHSVKMQVLFGGFGLESKGIQLDTLEHMKRSIMLVNADNSLAHELIIVIAKANNDTHYNSYRRGYASCPKSLV
jgi:hypothetical protein